MSRRKYRHRLTITLDDATLADLKHLRDAVGRVFSHVSGSSAVIRRLIRQAAGDLRARHDRPAGG